MLFIIDAQFYFVNILKIAMKRQCKSRYKKVDAESRECRIATLCGTIYRSSVGRTVG